MKTVNPRLAAVKILRIKENTLYSAYVESDNFRMGVFSQFVRSVMNIIFHISIRHCPNFVRILMLVIQMKLQTEWLFLFSNFCSYYCRLSTPDQVYYFLKI